ncbi:hypothetical protein [Cellulomonas dongxiuzhuiae]|uniref:hypothetical protein n=1 Tax=Cellulomonas dongxiuzhuiae TaxID=2819979 RepID=UPI001AB01D68|nr:hypothetical protein [Cellulomonas dongxiuzhuiae]MBO3088838.1 hypothetical protein [Cellulomonas dongxiuzhuiae]
MPIDFGESESAGIRALGERCRREALAALAKDDWHDVYRWTKSWVTSGGGAWLPDTWVLYAVSALLKGEPQTAVHALDLGLTTWIIGSQDRAVLRWCRGVIIWTRLNDPKTALTDLDPADALPAWFSAVQSDAIDRCAEDAVKSRKRVPSVSPSPTLATTHEARGTVAPSVINRRDGDELSIWVAVAPYFAT